MRINLVLLLCVGSAISADGPFHGRWDLQVTPRTGTSYPDWMELAESGGKATLRVQPRSGGARVIPEFQLAGSHLHFIFSKADQKNPEVVWDLDAAGERL